MTYLGLNTATPQSEPLIGTTQTANSAGGYVWSVDDWMRLDRFLILGSEGGNYYASERTLTKENANAIIRCVAVDGLRTVERIIAISEAGRAPKNDPALFALAIAASFGNPDTKHAACGALPRVARIGTHLFHFLAYVDQFRGWGRRLKWAVGNWYLGQPPERLAMQAIKYRQRDGWSHRDALRLAHPGRTDPQVSGIFDWITHGWPDIGDEPHGDPVLCTLWAFERVQRATTSAEVIQLITTYRLPREAIPTQWLNDAEVWRSLLAEMPMEAMIRNLAVMTRCGLIAPMSDAIPLICERLRNPERVRQARLHPIKILAALRTYASGHSEKGNGTWEPDGRILDALNAAFYLAFESVEPTNKRTLLALDISGSMGVPCAGMTSITAREASAALALVTAATEPNYHIMAFTTGPYPSMWDSLGSGLSPLTITPAMRLDAAVAQIAKMKMGGTNCAVPMQWALERKVPVDTFIIYTDSETWFGDVHPVEALRRYRTTMNIPARLVVVAMASNGFSIADPNDSGMLDVVGMDTATPAIIADFVV